jgi:hypothetical protein
LKPTGKRPDHGKHPKPGKVPVLALTHGQTLWLMGQLGFDRGVGATTFNYYIKSLRSLGIPFDKGKGQSEGHRHVTYELEEITELTVALLLRVYGILPDAVVEGLRQFRAMLHPIYRRAFAELPSRRKDGCHVAGPRGRTLAIEGLYLDLNICYSAGHLVEFGPPKVISPFEAMAAYAKSGLPGRSYLPLNLSAVAASIVERTQTLPPRRRRLDPAHAAGHRESRSHQR